LQQRLQAALDEHARTVASCRDQITALVASFPTATVDPRKAEIVAEALADSVVGVRRADTALGAATSASLQRCQDLLLGVDAFDLADAILATCGRPQAP